MAPKDQKEPSYGKIMTSLLIPKGLHSDPKRILSGMAFLAIIVVFLFSALNRSCQRDATVPNTDRPAQVEQGGASQ